MADFGYKKLGVWQLARELVVEIHAMTLKHLPRFELYEEGGQIRRSIKAVKSNIVEAWGRRTHKADYIKFLEYAYGSALETLSETASLTDKVLSQSLHDRSTHLCKALYRFIEAVKKQHNKPLSPPPDSLS